MQGHQANAKVWVALYYPDNKIESHNLQQQRG